MPDVAETPPAGATPTAPPGTEAKTPDRQLGPEGVKLEGPGLAQFSDAFKKLKEKRLSSSSSSSEASSSSSSSSSSEKAASSSSSSEDEVRVRKGPKKKRETQSSTEDVAIRTAAATAAEMARHTKPEPKKEPDADPLAGLPDEIVYKSEVLGELERIHPEKYKGIKKQWIDSIKALDSYQSKWEKENPGVEFNPDDPEHDDFYKKNDVAKYSERYYDEAKTSLHQRGKEDPEVKSLRKKVSEMELEPKIQNTAARATAALIEQIDEKYKGFDIAKLKDADPLVAEIVTKMDANTKPVIAEVLRLWSGADTYNPQNQTHDLITSFVHEMEHQLSKVPEEQSQYQGKPFMPMADYEKIPPNQRAHYWSFMDADAVIHHFTALNVMMAKEAIKSEEERYKMLAKRFGGNGNVANKGPASGSSSSASASSSSSSSAAPPSGAGRTGIDTGATDRQPGGGDFNKLLLGRLRGK